MGALSGLSGIAKAILNPIISGINDAINNINSVTGSIPVIGGSLHIPDIPKLATGGIVKASPGGTTLLAEAGQDELVTPLGSGRGGGNAAAGGGSGGVVNNFNIQISNPDPQGVVNALRIWMQRNGSLAAPE